MKQPRRFSPPVILHLPPFCGYLCPISSLFCLSYSVFGGPDCVAQIAKPAEVLPRLHTIFTRTYLNNQSLLSVGDAPYLAENVISICLITRLGKPATAMSWQRVSSLSWWRVQNMHGGVSTTIEQRRDNENTIRSTKSRNRKARTRTLAFEPSLRMHTYTTFTKFDAAVELPHCYRR